MNTVDRQGLEELQQVTFKNLVTATQALTASNRELVAAQQAHQEASVHLQSLVEKKAKKMTGWRALFQCVVDDSELEAHELAQRNVDLYDARIVACRENKGRLEKEVEVAKQEEAAISAEVDRKKKWEVTKRLKREEGGTCVLEESENHLTVAVFCAYKLKGTGSTHYAKIFVADQEIATNIIQAPVVVPFDQLFCLDVDLVSLHERSDPIVCELWSTSTGFTGVSLTDKPLGAVEIKLSDAPDEEIIIPLLPGLQSQNNSAKETPVFIELGLFQARVKDQSFEQGMTMPEDLKLRLVSLGIAPKLPTFEMGEKVEAAFRGKDVYYPARIVNVFLEWYTVQYDRSNFVEDNVLAQFIRKVQPVIYKAGERVQAFWKGGDYWFDATVTEMSGENLYTLLYDDGDSDPAVESRFIRYPQPPSYKVGEMVEAAFNSSGVFYLAKVIEATPEGYTIQYSDSGEVDENVPAKFLQKPQDFGYEKDDDYITLLLNSATNLPVKDLFTSDPYVKIKVGQFEAQSKYIPSTLNPTWNQLFCFKLPEKFQRRTGFMVLEVWDYDFITPDDFMCLAEIEWTSICGQELVVPLFQSRNGKRLGELQIQIGKGKVRGFHADQHQGMEMDPSIRASLSNQISQSHTQVFIKTPEPSKLPAGVLLTCEFQEQPPASVVKTDVPENSPEFLSSSLVYDISHQVHVQQSKNRVEPIGRKKVKPDFPLISTPTDMRVSAISFSAAEFKESEKYLTILLLSAADLPVMDMFTSDPYVKLQVGGLEAQSAYISSTLNPVWNQLFCFELPAGFEHRSECLVLELWDYDFLRPDDFMGKAVVKLASIHGRELKLPVEIKNGKSQGVLHVRIGKGIVQGFTPQLQGMKMEDAFRNDISMQIQQKCQPAATQIQLSGELREVELPATPLPNMVEQRELLDNQISDPSKPFSVHGMASVEQPKEKRLPVGPQRIRTSWPVLLPRKMKMATLTNVVMALARRPAADASKASVAQPPTQVHTTPIASSFSLDKSVRLQMSKERSIVGAKRVRPAWPKVQKPLEKLARAEQPLETYQKRIYVLVSSEGVRGPGFANGERVLIKSLDSGPEDCPVAVCKKYCDVHSTSRRKACGFCRLESLEPQDLSSFKRGYYVLKSTNGATVDGFQVGQPVVIKTVASGDIRLPIGICKENCSSHNDRGKEVPSCGLVDELHLEKKVLEPVWAVAEITGSEPFEVSGIAYSITVTLQDQQWLIFRQYADFQSLVNELEDEGHHISTPLPSQAVTFLDKMNPLFQSGLQQKLQLVLNEATGISLTESCALQDFLETDGQGPVVAKLFANSVIAGESEEAIVLKEDLAGDKKKDSLLDVFYNFGLTAKPGSPSKSKDEGRNFEYNEDYITLLLFSGTNLPVMDFRTSDPYVIIKVGQLEARSKYISSSLNPTWNQLFCFRLPEHFEKSKDSIVLEVWDYDFMRSDEFMGKAEIKWTSVNGEELAVPLFKGLNGERRGELQIQIGKGKVRGFSDDRHQGLEMEPPLQAALSKQIQKNNSQITQTIIPPAAEISGTGKDVFAVALCKYEPEFHTDIELRQEDNIQVHLQGTQWWEGTNQRSGEKGHFPANCVVLRTGMPSERLRDPLEAVTKVTIWTERRTQNKKLDLKPIAPIVRVFFRPPSTIQTYVADAPLNPYQNLSVELTHPICMHCGEKVLRVDGKFSGVQMTVQGTTGVCHEKCVEQYRMLASDKCRHCSRPVTEISEQFSGVYYNGQDDRESFKVHKECWDAWQEICNRPPPPVVLNQEGNNMRLSNFDTSKEMDLLDLSSFDTNDQPSQKDEKGLLADNTSTEMDLLGLSSFSDTNQPSQASLKHNRVPTGSPPCDMAIMPTGSPATSGKNGSLKHNRVPTGSPPSDMAIMPTGSPATSGGNVPLQPVLKDFFHF